MIPEQTHMYHRVIISHRRFTCSAAVCPPTCRGQRVQSLQAVFARRRVVSGLGEAALAVVQHGGWRDNARGRDFTHPQVQVLHLLLLIGLQVLHLCQVSAVRKENRMHVEFKDFLLEKFTSAFRSEEVNGEKW